MKTLDLDAILLSMLLVTMAMVSVVSATGQGFNEQNSVNVSNALNVPDHYIPPEYFMGAKTCSPFAGIRDDNNYPLRKNPQYIGSR